MMSNEAVCARETIHRRIATRAYELYVQEDYPLGKTLDHWLAAEAEMRKRGVRDEASSPKASATIKKPRRSTRPRVIPN